MDSEHDDSAGDAREPSVADVGARLRAAREALRLDLAHIAAETRIPLRHLETIELGNFEDLPSRAYAIGFSRTFAKAVGLDPAVITDAVRGELADGSMRRTTPSAGMEPGDPARLPSAGLAWAGAFAALLLMVGVFAFYNAYFGAGTEPGSLLTPTPESSATPTAARALPAAVPGPTSLPVVLTALDDGIWLRLYEEGGERLAERTLKLGETIEVPVTARDPRINTGRPDALAVTIGGKPVAKLSNLPETISGVPVSGSALIRRSVVPTDAGTAPVDETVAAAPTRRPPVRRSLSARRNEAVAPAGEPTPETAFTAPASDPALALGNRDGEQE